VSESPYLSIIVNSRNDDHGGQMGARMRATFTGHIEQLEAYRIPSELIVVDYNPPPDRPSLREALPWPAQTKYCTVRSVVVPAEVHQRYEGADRININVLLAQNVGLRRARGTFLLSTLADIMLSDALVEWLGQRPLRSGHIYRADRFDVNRAVLDEPTRAARLAYSRDHVLSIQTRHGRILVVRPKRHALSRDLEASRFRSPRLHTNAAGDFILMGRDDWLALRGFPERDTMGRYVDGLYCYLAHQAGIVERIIGEPCRSYHIDHESHWQDTSASRLEKALFYLLPDGVMLGLRSFVGRLLSGAAPNVLGVLAGEHKREREGLKPLTRKEYQHLIKRLREEGPGVVMNSDEWGLRDERLEEHTVVRAGWERSAAGDGRH
jgi:hypothetical protein